jgi:hypothetical protein
MLFQIGIVYTKSTFSYYHWVGTTAAGLLVPPGIILPVVSVRHMFY